jgi:hypothetical protein
MNQDFHAPQARANAARYEACLLSAPSKQGLGIVRDCLGSR